MIFENEKQEAFHKVSLHFADVLKDYNAYDFIALLTGHPDEGLTYKVASHDPIMTLMVNLNVVLESLESVGLIEQGTSVRVTALILRDAVRSVEGDLDKLPEFLRTMLGEDNIRQETNRVSVLAQLESAFEFLNDDTIDDSTFISTAKMLSGVLTRSKGGSNGNG